MATLESNILDLATSIASEIKKDRIKINGNAADLSALTTTNKTNLVAAINEIAGAIGEAGASIDDEAISTLTVWSSDKTDSEIDSRVAALAGTAPELLNTLGEISDALGDDPNFATTITGQIASKADTSSVVLLTGNQTVAGVKTFSSSPVVPDSSFSIAKITGLQTALDAKQAAGSYAAATHTHAGSAITSGTVGAAYLPSATETALGIVELATTVETTTGTDATRAATPAGVKAVADTKANVSHTHTAANISDSTTIGRSVLTAADAAAVRTAIGAGTPYTLPAASETVVGGIELATLAGVTTGTSTTLVPTVAGLRQEINTRAATVHTHTASQVADFNTAADARVNALVPTASESAAGKVELATTTEATTGTDTARAVTPAGLKAVADTKAATVHGHALTDANITGVLPIAQIPTGTTGSTVALGNHTHTAAAVGAIPSFTDPNADRIVFWDDSASAYAALTAGTGLNITTTTLSVITASDTAAGIVELATSAEAISGAATTLAVTPAALLAVVGDSTTNFVSTFEAGLV